MEKFHLIVGLGNPGAKYAHTRHNAGYMLADKLAVEWRAKWSEQKKFQSRVARVERDGERIILAEPLTFMNESGAAVRALVEFYKISPTRLLVLVDDADLPLGTIRLRPGGGSSGGHHGIESIAGHVGTKDFLRLRLGIGRRADGIREITDYVLAEFRAGEQKLLRQVLERGQNQIECWLSQGIEKAMNQFNGVIEDSTEETKSE